MKKRNTERQLEISFRRGRGGKREGAGRKRTVKGSRVSHRRRSAFASRHPVHVTMKLRRDVGTLRTKSKVKVLRTALSACRQRAGGRVIHWSIQRDHIHLIAEASSAEALSRSMQGLSIRIAKGLNRLLGRKGAVFLDRYHVHILKTPREVRNALAYVLNNARRHAAQRGVTLARTFVDAFSSWQFFDGWKDAPVATREPDPEAPVSPPKTWLLRVGRRCHGLLSIREVPGRRV